MKMDGNDHHGYDNMEEFMTNLIRECPEIELLSESDVLPECEDGGSQYHNMTGDGNNTSNDNEQQHSEKGTEAEVYKYTFICIDYFTYGNKQYNSL